MDIDVDKLKNSDVFCLAPWMHSIIDPDGIVSPCCFASGKDFGYGSLHEKTLKEIWNSDQIKKMRLDMLNGIKRPECSKCYLYEDMGRISHRKQLNQEFSKHFDFVKETKSDGTFERFNISYWDFRLNNVCNFKCRSCGEKNSTTWAKEILKERPNSNIPILLTVDNNPVLWEQIEELYPIVERISFAGGEPLIMESHYKILDKLIEYKKFDVELVYTTNFSTLVYKDKNVLDYWEKFPNLTVHASVDGFGKRGELIRKGFDWDKFIDNANQFHERFTNKLDNKSIFRVTCTVQLLNSFHLIDLHKELYNKKIIKDLDNFCLNFLFNPSYMSSNCLSSVGKKQVIEKVKDYILNYLRPQGADDYEFISYIKFLVLESKNSEVKKFIEQTNYFDKIRNENTRKTFPEFEEIIWKHYSQ